MPILTTVVARSTSMKRYCFAVISQCFDSRVSGITVGGAYNLKKSSIITIFPHIILYNIPPYILLFRYYYVVLALSDLVLQLEVTRLTIIIIIIIIILTFYITDYMYIRIQYHNFMIIMVAKINLKDFIYGALIGSR